LSRLFSLRVSNNNAPRTNACEKREGAYPDALHGRDGSGCEKVRLRCTGAVRLVCGVYRRVDAVNRVAFFQVQDCRPVKTDWHKIICDLNAAGVTCVLIADVLGVGRVTVWDWKCGKGAQGRPKATTGPRHDQGEALLAMHARFCGKK
jgi:hypothetical protein